MESINVAPELVACCGLYCAACRKYVAGKCPGCRAHNEKHWCKVLACCRQKGFETCAECTSPGSGNLQDLHSPIANVYYSTVFRSGPPGLHRPESAKSGRGISPVRWPLPGNRLLNDRKKNRKKPFNLVRNVGKKPPAFRMLIPALHEPT
jgi:hypothetical protein